MCAIISWNCGRLYSKPGARQFINSWAASSSRGAWTCRCRKLGHRSGPGVPVPRTVMSGEAQDRGSWCYDCSISSSSVFSAGCAAGAVGHFRTSRGPRVTASAGGAPSAGRATLADLGRRGPIGGDRRADTTLLPYPGGSACSSRGRRAGMRPSSSAALRSWMGAERTPNRLPANYRKLHRGPAVPRAATPLAMTLCEASSPDPLLLGRPDGGALRTLAHLRGQRSEPPQPLPWPPAPARSSALAQRRRPPPRHPRRPTPRTRPHPQ